jgi:CAAX prenyl protease-like protein
VVFRVVGYVVVAPLAEELAFRAYLTRRLATTDIDRIPLGQFGWLPFLLSSLLFGALHGSLWMAGTLAGIAFALALYRRRMLGDAVVAHATTNALLAVCAWATGRWSVWS